jgi:hypothetical protein
MLVWAKLILGRFRDAVLPDFFSRFPAGSDDNLFAFFTDPRHGRYFGRYVPARGLGFVCASFACYIARYSNLKIKMSLSLSIYPGAEAICTFSFAFKPLF